VPSKSGTTVPIPMPRNISIGSFAESSFRLSEHLRAVRNLDVVWRERRLSQETRLMAVVCSGHRTDHRDVDW